jgi:hypothetical protein
MAGPKESLKGSMFFSEEKNQKTFIYGEASLSGQVPYLAAGWK